MVSPHSETTSLCGLISTFLFQTAPWPTDHSSHAPLGHTRWDFSSPECKGTDYSCRVPAETQIYSHHIYCKYTGGETRQTPHSVSPWRAAKHSDMTNGPACVFVCVNTFLLFVYI
ncbi:hypothetical protein AMEX_G1868 [Astyanax mexicanus]|uniref:Uncharacterized protein n=1 Tax=Astyanax mexicanus TaxID=7994 RepID=A0A8T2MHR3_ASTMX|nr:hypothetical protein AMEX_G1868 [Astyanax mexicanus]